MQNKKNWRMRIFLTLFTLLFIPSIGVLAKVEIGENFSQAYTQYVKGLPENQSFGSGSEEVYPYYLHPISNLNLSLNKLSKQNFKRGEEINLTGSLNFTFDGKKIIAKLEKDCLEKVNNAEICSVNSNYSLSELGDVGIFVQVWRADNEPENSKKGDYLVQEFYLTEGLTLKDGKGGVFNYKWKVPAETKEGRYYFSFYVNSNKNFDLNGSPLVTFNSAKNQDFYVEKAEGSKNGVEINKNNLKINGAEYSYRNVAPSVNGGQEVTFVGSVLNYDSEEKAAKVKYTLSRWGQEDPKDLVLEKTEDLNLLGSSDTPIKFIFPTKEGDSVYNLKTEVKTAGGISTSNVRLVLNNYHRGVFRYLGFLEAANGKLVPMFCIRDAQWSGSLKGTVAITAQEASGKNVLEWKNTGQIGAGNDKCFVPKDKNIDKSVGCVKMKANISNEKGVINDQKEASFGCEVKDNSGFKYQDPIKSKVLSDSSQIKKSNLSLFIFAILFFAVFVLIIFLINKKNDKKNEK